MRVLLYVETHPIRGTTTHFSDVAKQFLTLTASPTDFDVRIFANDGTYKQIDDRLSAQNQKNVIRTTRSEEEILEHFAKLPWSQEGLAAWLQLMAGEGDVTEFHLGVINRIWQLFPFEVVIHWGENGAINRFINSRPVKRVALELGCTRPPFLQSIVMDPFGTNGSALVSKLSVDDLKGIVNNSTMSRHEAMFAFSKEISAAGYALQFQPISAQMDNRYLSNKVAFLPLQLFDDANLIRFSSYKTLMDVVLDVIPKLAAAGFVTIVKPHPASRYRPGALHENLLARSSIRRWSDKVIWLDEDSSISNTRLFSLADLVVTVNSSVGFEALYFDKTIVVLGDAVYKPKNMFPSLDEVIKGEYDNEQYLHAAGILRRFMLGGYLQTEKTLKDPFSFFRQVATIKQIAGTGDADAVCIARDYWRSCAPYIVSIAHSAMLWGISVPGRNEFLKPSVPPKEPSSGLAKSDINLSDMRLYEVFIQKLCQLYQATVVYEWLQMESKTDVDLATISDFISSSDFALSNGLNDEKSDQQVKINTEVNAVDELIEYALSVIQNKTLTLDETDLINKQSAFRSISERLSKDNAEEFIRWLDSQWKSQASRANLIVFAQFVDVEYYISEYKDIEDANVDPVEHYSWTGVDELRLPRRDFVEAPAESILTKLKIAAGDLSPIISSYPLSAEDERVRVTQIDTVSRGLSASGNRLVVVAHLYYFDVVDEILSRLHNIEEPFDLIVTTPQWGSTRIVETVKQSFPGAFFYKHADRGRDIAPFIDLLPTILEKKYDAILKIQTKKGYFRAGHMIPRLGSIWKQETFDALIGSQGRVASIIDALRTNKNLNMIGPQPFFLSFERYPFHDGGLLARVITGDHAIVDGCFYAGTMFWARPSCLQPLCRLSMPNFSPETGANDGMLEHLVERLFGAVAGVGSFASAPVDFNAPLDFKPLPSSVSVDYYLSERQKLANGGNDHVIAGDLLW